MIDSDCCDLGVHLTDIFDCIKYNRQFADEHPNYFSPEGFTCWCGPQGSGKTLSMVLYVINIMKKYPMCKLVTNLNILDYPIVTFEEFKEKYHGIVTEPMLKMSASQLDDFWLGMYYKFNRVFPFVDNDDFTKYRNGEYGVLYAIDELHLYLNSLQSKNVNPDTMATICQQRKQRLQILGTCQVYGRLSKPLREAFNCVMLCKNYFKVLQCNALVDRESLGDDSDNTSSALILNGKVKRKFWWTHSPSYYKLYDTYAIIEKGKFASREKMIDFNFEG